jgi:glycosyltransferase involved in cell wall biosynthesis
MDLVFLSHITPEELSIKIESISNAANYYQLKVEKALKPKLLISILPLPAKGVSLPPEFNSNKNRVFLNGRCGKNKVSKIIIDSYDAIKLVGFRKDVLFYSLNIQTIVIFWISKIILRNRNYVIIADFEVSNGFNNSLRSLFQSLINYSYRFASGTLVLNKNIKVNSNTVVCNALIDQNELIEVLPNNINNTNKKILFSGSIGYTTGVDVAIEAMNFLPNYHLLITGKLYGINIEELEILLAKSKYKNVDFLGNLSYEEYLNLLNQSSVTLSLRDPKDVQHFYNFPSKIVEYLSFNKFVVSTINYGEISKNLLVSNFDGQSVSDVISTIDSMVCEDSRSIVVDKFGFKSFNEKMSNLLN